MLKSLVRTSPAITAMVCLFVLLSLLALFPEELVIPLTFSKPEAGIPSGPISNAGGASEAAISLGAFADLVANGNGDQLVGVFVERRIAFRVAQQPSNAPGYVSQQPDMVTQFALASRYGTIGLLAHNYLAGNRYYDLEIGDRVALVYGDRHIRYYVVVDIDRYQALQPTNPYSDFLDLENASERLSSTDLFYRIYAGDNGLVFQTCIQANGSSPWGRYFIAAKPANFSRLRQMASQTYISMSRPR